jgi:predicted HAD superfamily Cof-like phosphohydrolase
MVFQAHGQFNMEETIDGCCDLSVVTIGTLSTLGVPDKPFLEEVDNNNLAKFGPGGYRNDYGKWVKPPGHKPPDISRILSELTLDHHDTEENPRG